MTIPTAQPSELLSILAELIQYQSISPKDAGCQTFMMEYLQQLGFKCQQLDKPPVSNFYAQIGTQSPLLVFAGHTDVVTPGDDEKWLNEPFVLTCSESKLYGRGVADMKGALACMLDAAKQFLKNKPNFQGSLGFLITSGEEGDDFLQGTPHVMAALEQQGTHIDYCIVGEPSSHQRAGDTIKIGRRGSLTAHITVNGIQGHVAYPHLARNPIHEASVVIAELCQTEWDAGNQHFPPTTLQITRIESGGEASNVIPAQLFLRLNFRFSTEQTAEGLQEKVQQCFQRHKLNPSIQWTLNGNPFLTEKGKLLDSCNQAIQHVIHQLPEHSTSGGTSDGRFIAPYGVEVIELGLCNESIHQINENIAEKDLITLRDIYLEICNDIFQ